MLTDGRRAVSRLFRGSDPAAARVLLKARLALDQRHKRGHEEHPAHQPRQTRPVHSSLHPLNEGPDHIPGKQPKSDGQPGGRREGNQAAADGSGAQELRSSPQADPNLGSGYTASWSPTGTQLAWVEFRQNPNPVIGLAVVPADGGKAMSLTPKGTPPGILDVQPAWSPDGQRIAVASLRDQKTLRIYLIQPDGSGARPLISDATELTASPRWGP